MLPGPDQGLLDDPLVLLHGEVRPAGLRAGEGQVVPDAVHGVRAQDVLAPDGVPAAGGELVPVQQIELVDVVVDVRRPLRTGDLVERRAEDGVVEGVVVAEEVDDLPVVLRRAGPPVLAQRSAQPLDAVDEAEGQLDPDPDDLIRQVGLGRPHAPLRRVAERHVYPLALEHPVGQLAQPGRGPADVVVLQHLGPQFVQREREPGDGALPRHGPAPGRPRVDQVHAEVGLPALLADVAARRRSAGRAAAADVGLVEVLTALAVKQRRALLRGDPARVAQAGEERPERGRVPLIPAGVSDLVGMDVHEGQRLGDLAGVVLGHRLGRAALAPGALGHVALEVVGGGQVPHPGAVHPLEPDEGVGAQVGPGQVADVQPAVGRRRRREREHRAVAEPPPVGARRDPRGPRGVAPVEGREQHVVGAGVVQVVRLERLELEHHAGADRGALAVHHDVAAAGDDHEGLGLVVLVRVGVAAGRHPAPVRAHPERLDGAHVDLAQVDPERGMQRPGVIRTGDHWGPLPWQWRPAGAGPC